jgi:hypothetical protein
MSDDLMTKPEPSQGRFDPTDENLNEHETMLSKVMTFIFMLQ